MSDTEAVTRRREATRPEDDGRRGDDGRARVARRLAVADLGSNSFRLVVFTAQDGWWKRTDEIYEAVRIGEGLAASGRLGEAPIARALATIEVFAHFAAASGLGVGEVDGVATSAIRDAANASEFLVPARELLPVRVLSREQEARYGYLAAVNSTTLADGCVLDLGGGSLQLVAVSGRIEGQMASWPLGAVRMTERFLPDSGLAKRRQLLALSEHVRAEIASAPWVARSGARLVGIGGTVRNLAAAAQRGAGLPSQGVQGQQVTLEVLEGLIEQFAALPATERASIPGIKPGRADLILAGAVVVAAVMDAGGFASLEATEAGLREGVFFERYLADSQPPLFADVRRESVLNLAAQYHPDPPHTAHVAELALRMFDGLAAAGLHAGDAVDRELLWAASILHDVGMAVDYDDHHKHTAYLILSAGLPGFTPRETALIALAARYHRKGMPDPGQFERLLDADDGPRLDRFAVLLRLAEDLERSRDQVVRDVQVTVADGVVSLRLVADGATTVSRWAAARETALFERAFGRRLVVVE